MSQFWRQIVDIRSTFHFSIDFWTTAKCHAVEKKNVGKSYTARLSQSFLQQFFFIYFEVFLIPRI